MAHANLFDRSLLEGVVLFDKAALQPIWVRNAWHRIWDLT